MIQLHHDCLLFKMPSGETIPCSAELVTVELVGDFASSIDPSVLQNSASAVLHYFKYDLGREQVTIGEFSEVLERVLRHLGLNVKSLSSEPSQTVNIEAADLRAFATEPDFAFELSFFQRLRAELHTRLTPNSRVIAFSGLRPCVKRLAGAKRWCPRCQALNDQIIDYLRTCLKVETENGSCELVVR